MKDAPSMKKPDPIGDIPPVNDSNTFNFSIALYEGQGTCQISFIDNFPGEFRLAVALYAGVPPSDRVRSWLWAREVTHSSSGHYAIDKPWGSGYSAALLVWGANTNDWIYLGVTTPVTKKS
jgi:hypothetical protein